MYNQPTENQNLNNEQNLYNPQPIDNPKKQISSTKFIVEIILLTIICVPLILFCFMISGLTLMAGDSGSLGFLKTLMIAAIFFGLQICPTAIYVYAILSEWRKYKPHPYSKSWEIYAKIMKIITILFCIAILIFIIQAIASIMLASSIQPEPY